MVLVEHQPVEAHLLGVDLLVEVAVVELAAELRVVDVVGDVEVAEVAAVHLRGLVGAFGEVADLHGLPLVVELGDQAMEHVGLLEVDPVPGVGDDLQAGVGQQLDVLVADVERARAGPSAPKTTSAGTRTSPSRWRSSRLNMAGFQQTRAVISLEKSHRR